MKQPRSRLIVSHACVLLAGFALGAWLWPSASPPENNKHPVSGGILSSRNSDSLPARPGAGTSDAAGRDAPKKDGAPTTRETYIRIPLRLAEHFSVPQTTD